MAEPPSTKRRDVLNWLVGIWGGGVFASVLYPVLRFLAPPEVPEATSLTVSAGKASSLLPNSARLVPFGAEPAIVVRLPGGELRALRPSAHTCRARSSTATISSRFGARVTTVNTTSTDATLPVLRHVRSRRMTST